MPAEFAYINSEKHLFNAWMRKKGSWRANCTCNRMLEKTGSLAKVTDDWREHIRVEAERKETTPYWTSIR